ncbi:MAG TPA: ABC transporter ATP-binding protein [Bellilinea sp.]|nr:ABC transporter ATP-binding protein [Bellilinea sp.]
MDSVSFDVPDGTIFGLIGPNGAGKTTLLNCLSRVYRHKSGDITFAGRSISKLAPHAIPRLGIARTFQNLAVFHSMTVLENVLIGAHCRSRAGFIASALRPRWVGAEEARLKARALEIARYLDLWRLAERQISELPFALKKRVELGRALAAEPRLLLLDEPAAGLNELEVRELRDLINDVGNRYDLTVLLVEHHMGLVMSVTNRIAVLNFGKKIAEGRPEEIRRNPEVVAAYLGTVSRG